MKYADVVEIIMRKLLIARDADVGEILAALGYYRMGNLSARNNARKILKYLTELGRLEEGGENGSGGFFRIPGGTKSNFGEHSRHLTRALVKILKVFPDSQVVREKEIPVKLVPDAIVELAYGNKRQICILEVVLNEPVTYLQSKIAVWQTWEGSIGYLSKIFGYRIPHFEIVCYPESPLKEVWNFDDFMKEAIG